MRLGSLPAALLVAPAMALVLLLFVLPLASTLWGALQGSDGLTLHHFATAFLLDVLKGDQEAHKALLPGAVTFEEVQYTTTLK